MDNSAQQRSVSPLEVLAELSVLLDNYAPTWYGEEQHSRVLAAQLLPTMVLVEVCALLEEYAPTWYTEKERDRMLAALKQLGILE